MIFESTFKTSKVSIHYVQKYSGPDIVWCPGGDQIGKDWEEQFNFFPAQSHKAMSKGPCPI